MVRASRAGTDDLVLWGGNTGRVTATTTMHWARRAAHTARRAWVGVHDVASAPGPVAAPLPLRPPAAAAGAPEYAFWYYLLVCVLV